MTDGEPQELPSRQAKIDVLSSLSFGQRVAEDEVDELADYFVETDQWRRMYAGEIDVVYGPKGSGKSAIYSILVDRASELFDRGILIVPAENPRGAPAFGALVVDPPTSEQEFVDLWKLYLLSLVARVFVDFDIRNEAGRFVLDRLQEAGVPVEPRGPLNSVLNAVRQYARLVSGLETAITLDPATGAPSGVTGRISFREPSVAEREAGVESVDALFRHASDGLEEAGFHVWVMLDRLDVAFAESPDLEKNALRALFKVYRDLQALARVTLKVFLRTDIWEAITQDEGFREASHVTRQLTLSWGRQTLLKLVMQRLLRNEGVVRAFDVEIGRTLEDLGAQEALFYRVFPDQVDLGPRRPRTFDWMLGRTSDGHGATAPRELIHLLNETRNVQIKLLEAGMGEPLDEQLFDRQAIREALPEVSRVKLEQTLYAEYPGQRAYMEALQGEKTEQTPETLATIWSTEAEEARRRADELVDIGFFERRGNKEAPHYWVPFLHRPALGMVQGVAD